MKKIVAILLFIFCIISFGIVNVSALNEIELKNISVESKSENASIDILSFNDLKFNIDLSLHDVDDYVTYKIVLKNNSNRVYKIDSITDDNELEYINNIYEFNEKEFKPNSEIEVLVTTKYIKRISKYREEFNKSLNIKINYTNGKSTIIETNPNTNDSINNYIVLSILCILLTIIILVTNKKIKNMVLILLLMILIPSVYALDIININNNIKIILSGGNYLNDELISKSNDLNIEYNDDTKGEVFKFSHPSTEQTEALEDYRFIGDVPNNYVYFNCADEEDISTCEIWRIIGVFDVEDENGNFEKRTKIIPNYNFALAWDEENANEWSTSTGMKYLNEGEFWNNLSDSSKSMIKPTKYYLGSPNRNVNNTIEMLYNGERSLSVISGRSISWIGNIGIIYSSDYGYVYSKGYDDICSNDVFHCYKKNSWIYELTNEQWTWSITPIKDGYANAAFAVNTPSYINGAAQTSCNFYVNVTAYLSKNVYVINGDGTKDNPYQLRINT